MTHLLISYSIRTWPRLALIAACLWAGLALGLGWGSLALLIVPFTIDALGSRKVAEAYEACKSELAETLKAQAAREAELAEDDERFLFVDYDGLYKHWLLGPRPARMILTLTAPKSASLVIITRQGTIFPPRSIHPPAFATSTTSHQEYFYHDISAIDMKHTTITMRMADGESVTHEDRSGQGGSAVRAIRDRLRAFKSAR